MKNQTINQIEAVSNSYELFNLINEHRVLAGKKPMNKHYELVKKMKDELGDLQGNKKVPLQYSLDNQGFKEFDAYELTRRDVFLVSMRESKEVRASIYDYIESLENELQELKDNIYHVITHKGFLGQELGLKCAGIKHPRLFMEFINVRNKWKEHITTDNNYFGKRRVGANESDTILAWSQDGFEWLVRNREYINQVVDNYKKFKAQKVVA